jgi:hypothetical protein
MKVHVNCSAAQAQVTITKESLESSAQYSSFRNEQLYAFGAGRIVRSGLRSVDVESAQAVGQQGLTCEGELNEDYDAKYHEHHVEDELFVVVHRHAVVNPGAMTMWC